MSKKKVKLTEKDLRNIVKRVIKEQVGDEFKQLLGQKVVDIEPGTPGPAGSGENVINIYFDNGMKLTIPNDTGKIEFPSEEF